MYVYVWVYVYVYVCVSMHMNNNNNEPMAPDSTYGIGSQWAARKAQTEEQQTTHSHLSSCV